MAITDDFKLEPAKDEVEVTQYLRPDGKKQRVFAQVGEDLAAKCGDLILSAEVLSTGLIAIYARFKDEGTEAEIMDLAENGPGDKSPAAVLTKLITRKLAERGL